MSNDRPNSGGNLREVLRQQEDWSGSTEAGPTLPVLLVLPGEGSRRGQLAGGKGSMEKFQSNEPAEDQKTSEANTNSNSGESP